MTFTEIGEAKKKLADEEKMAYVNKVLDEADQKTQFELDQKRAEGRKKGIKEFPEDTKEGVRKIDSCLVYIYTNRF